MKVIRGAVLPAALFAVLFQVSPAAAAQLVTIRFDPNAPVSPIGSDAEYQAMLRIQDEQNPNTRIRLISDFLSDYPRSEYQYLVLRMRFQIRREQGEPEAVIEAAQEALDAHEYFFNGKMGFIDDPDSVEQVPAFRLDFASQKETYYRTMMEAYRAMEDVENTLLYGEMALEAEDEAWTLYTGQADAADPQFASALEGHQVRQAVVLSTLMAASRVASDVPGELTYARRLLEVSPDDLQTLMRVSQIMSQPQEIPEDSEARDAHLEAAEGYAERAVSAVESFVASEASVDVEEPQKASLVSQAHSALGMIRFQKGEFAEAAEAYGAAAESVPDPVTYYLLGVCHTNDQNVDGAVSALARAVFLEFPQPQARQLLEVAYEVKTGSLEGLDEFIQSEGEQLTAGQ